MTYRIEIVASGELVAVCETLDNWQIALVGFDLDSTLVDTTRVFKDAVNDASGILIYGADWEKVKTEPEAQQRVNEYRHDVFDPIIFRLRDEFGINPVIGEVVIGICAKLSGVTNEEQIEEAKARIRQIYTQDIPPLFPGASESVDLINATNRPTWLMTHAEAEWTRNKVNGVKLDGKFARHICFSIDQSKAEQWVPTFERENIDPERFLMIGDNFTADVWPILRLGGRAILVSGGFSPRLSSKQRQEIEENRHLLTNGLQIGTIGDLGRALTSPLSYPIQAI